MDNSKYIACQAVIVDSGLRTKMTEMLRKDNQIRSTRSMKDETRLGLIDDGWRFVHLVLISRMLRQPMEGDLALHKDEIMEVLEVNQERDMLELRNPLSGRYTQLFGIENARIVVTSMKGLPTAFLEHYEKSYNAGQDVQLQLLVERQVDQHPDWKPSYSNPDDPPTVFFWVPVIKEGYVTIRWEDAPKQDPERTFTYREVLHLLRAYRLDLIAERTQIMGDTVRGWLNERLSKESMT